MNRTRETKRKQHQIVSDNMENTNGSSEEEKIYLRLRIIENVNTTNT